MDNKNYKSGWCLIKIRQTIACFFIINFCGYIAASNATDALIPNLRMQGWELVDKFEEIQKFSGEGQYKNLVRVVHKSYFVFEKQGKRKICWISYDSQRDKISENCEKKE